MLPFRGLRFRPELPGGLAGTIGPATDLESSAEARAFARHRPYSAVWLEIEDQAEGLHFHNARALLDRWRDEQALVLDDSPCYYIYEHEFDDEGVRRTRRGVFGLVPLDTPEVCVLPHEETWEENRRRRLQLLRDLDSSISPVFLIYDGAGTSQPPAELIDSAMDDLPTASATDDSGDVHRLWVMSDPVHVEQMLDAMRGQHFIIADGHHRFAAARLYHHERQTRETSLVLAYCVDAEDPGVVIRPIHRLLMTRDSVDWISAVGQLHEWFEIETEPVAGRSGRELARTLTGGELPVAGVIVNDAMTFVRLTLRSWDIAERLLPDDLAGPARTLDVSVVTELVIRRALEVSAEVESSDVAFLTDADDMLATVRQGGGIGILMRPIRLRQVLAVARAHARVPAKSTSFIPKAPIGLVLHQFSIASSEFPVEGSSGSTVLAASKGVIASRGSELGTRKSELGTDA